MTSEANESAKAGTSDADNGNGDQGSNANAADPFSGLDAGTREWIGTKGYKSVADVAKAAQNAESLIGKSVRLPGADAKPEDWEQFFAKLRPATPDEYEFTRPEDLPEEQFQSDAKAFKAALHKVGLTKVQAKAVADLVFGSAAEAIKADRAAMSEKAEKTFKDFEAMTGPQDSDAFNAGVRLVNRVLNDQGGEALTKELKDAGLMSPAGVILSPLLGKLLLNVGKQLYREDTVHRGDTAVAENPFKDGPDKGNLTEQNRLIKADRAQAERLMRAAGRDPKEWGLVPAAA